MIWHQKDDAMDVVGHDHERVDVHTGIGGWDFVPDLLNCCTGRRSMHFAVFDSTEQMQPLLDAPPPVHAYAPGSWGPPEAEQLTAEYGGWHGPWLAS